MKQSCTWFLAFCLLTAVSCGKKKQDASALTEHATVQEVSLRDVIAQTGEVRSTVKVDLKCEASGKIESLYVKEGELVKKGQKILVIDPERLITRKKALDLSAEQSKINMQLAQREYDNNIELAKIGSVSQKVLDDSKSQLDLRTISHKQQLLDLEDIESQLRQTRVTSPMNGVLTVLNVKEGEIAVSATGGYSNPTAIGTIVDINKLEVMTQIGEVDYVNLKLGQKVVIKPEAIENAQTYGTITFLSLTAKKENSTELGSFQVLVSIDSIIPGIAPGVNVNVEFVILEKQKVLGIPYHFVKKEDGQSSVLVALKNGKGPEKLEKRTVQTGSTDYKNWEILSGLQKGDVVVYKSQTPEEENANTKKRVPRTGFAKAAGGGRR
jgi:RND family efflux transporter MFP subunit